MLRCVLVVTVLVAAVGAASVSQSVSVSGSSGGGETVSVSETSSSISSDTGATLGTRSSFSSKRREPAAASRPPATGLRKTPVAGTVQSQRPATGTVQKKPVATGTVQRPRPVAGTVQRQRPVTGTAQSQRPVTGTVQSQRPVTGTAQRQQPATTGTGLLAAQAAVSGGVPSVPFIRPLKPFKIHVPSLAPVGGTLGTRFNNRASASPAAVAPALAGVQANLQATANHLNAVMASLGV